MNILYSINRAVIPFFLTSLGSIVKNGGEESYDVYVLYSDLSVEERKELEKAVSERVRLRFVYVSPDLFEGFPESKRYPQQIYYRIAAPLLLPSELDRILYLDTDTVVINPLKELYETEMSGNYFAACTHTRAFLTEFNRLRVGAAENAPYINSGVLLMALEPLRKALDLKEIRAWTEKKKGALWLPDQDILFAFFGEKIKPIDGLRYNVSDRAISVNNMSRNAEKIDLDWVKKNSVVVHYYGRNKPWKKNYKGILGCIYEEAATDIER